MTCVTLPMFLPFVLMKLSSRVKCVLFQRLSTADDIRQLGRNRRLPGTVVLPGQILDHVVAGVRGGLHRDHSRHLFADGGICETLEEADFDCLGE